MPTTTEAGFPEIGITTWYGLYAPAGTPRAVIGRLASAASNMASTIRSYLPFSPAKEGPLSGLEGLFVQDKTTKGRLVLNVELLGRSVAVEVDCTAVRAKR